jgi:hypothetical protein
MAPCFSDCAINRSSEESKRYQIPLTLPRLSYISGTTMLLVHATTIASHLPMCTTVPCYGAAIGLAMLCGRRAASSSVPDTSRAFRRKTAKWLRGNP